MLCHVLPCHTHPRRTAQTDLMLWCSANARLLPPASDRRRMLTSEWSTATQTALRQSSAVAAYGHREKGRGAQSRIAQCTVAVSRHALLRLAARSPDSPLCRSLTVGDMGSNSGARRLVL